MPNLIPNFRSPVVGNIGARPIVIPKTVNLTLDGNSLTAYAGYPEKLPALYKPAYIYTQRSFALAGQTTAQMNADAATQINKPEHIDKTYNIIYVWEGINDLYLGATVQQAYDNLKTYCLNRRAYGFKVLIGTLTPRTNAGTYANYEADRLSVNVKLRTNWYDFADGIVDIGGDELLGITGASNNTTYYVDLVHMTNAGNVIVATQLSKAINILLP